MVSETDMRNHKRAHNMACENMGAGHGMRTRLTGRMTVAWYAYTAREANTLTIAHAGAICLGSTSTAAIVEARAVRTPEGGESKWCTRANGTTDTQPRRCGCGWLLAAGSSWQTLHTEDTRPDAAAACAA